MIDENYILTEFGKNLREARLLADLSQEALALELGFDRTYIGLLERGKRNPSLKTICKIAAHLEIQPSNLMPVLKFKKNKK